MLSHRNRGLNAKAQVRGNKLVRLIIKGSWLGGNESQESGKELLIWFRMLVLQEVRQHISVIQVELEFLSSMLDAGYGMYPIHNSLCYPIHN